ncbi:MAG: hypothetical protein JST26_17340 [Bacteroidetes bacterium]|nr:hypothetical protein [Bacteroidota bacterium]
MNDKEQFESFDASRFVACEFVFMLCCTVLGLIYYSQQEFITITTKELIVKPFLFGKSRSYLLTDLEDITWGDLNINSAGQMIGKLYMPGHSSSKQEMTLYFKGRNSLTYTNKQYENLYELRAYMLNYAAKHGLIKNNPIPARQQREAKRRLWLKRQKH